MILTTWRTAPPAPATETSSLLRILRQLRSNVTISTTTSNRWL